MKQFLVNPLKTAPLKRPIIDEQASLKKWNIWLAVLHVLQALTVFLLSVEKTFPVSVAFLTPDELATKATGDVVLAPATHILFNVNVAHLIALFFVLSAIAHALMASGLYRRRYESDLKAGVNRLRWLEYALSASVMIVAIGLISGVYDAASLIMLFALTAVMNLLGLVMETHNNIAKRQQPNWLSFIVGSLAGIVPWLVLALYLLSTNLFGSGTVPVFVYWIYASMFVLFTSFAVNMYLQYKKQGKWANYYFGERGYMILSLVAKSALAWQIFAGTLRP